MPGPKPGALPAWRPPSAFGFKSGLRLRFSLSTSLKLTAGETPLGRSAGESSNPICSDRTAAILHRTVSRRTCPDFDLSSQRAGIAMLLMRFFAVNPPLARACTDSTKLWISGYFVVGFTIQRRRRDHLGERRALANPGRRAFGLLDRVEQAKDGPAAARHLRGTRARIFK
jgi:hypothetical protein